MTAEARQSLGRRIAAAGIVAAGFCFITGLYAVGLTDKNAASRDYIGYWAAGQQLVHDANPYDPQAVLRLEEAVGLGTLQMKLTPSPPFGLALVLPLGFLHAKTGLVFWLMLQLVAFSLAILTLWQIQRCPPSRIHLLGYLFPPALACIMAGQLGIFFLLGLALFLKWKDSAPFWAGAALFSFALKPHIFLPFGVVLLLWLVVRRAFGVLAGFLLALASSYALVLMFDPHVWSQFLTMLHTNGLGDRFAPSFSAYLRLLVDRHAVWLQYLAIAGAVLWSAGYFWTRRQRWDWLDHGMLVLVVSLLCAPYAWITDEAVLLPAVMVGIYRAVEAKRSLVPIAVLGGVALIELFAGIRVTAWYYLWSVPAWLAWFLYATRQRSAAAEDAAQPARV